MTGDIVRICSDAQLYAALLPQTPAPLAPGHNRALSLLSPKENTTLCKGCLLATSLEKAKHSHHTYGHNSNIGHVRGWKITLQWKINKGKDG